MSDSYQRHLAKISKEIECWARLIDKEIPDLEPAEVASLKKNTLYMGVLLTRVIYSCHPRHRELILPFVFPSFVKMHPVLKTDLY